MQWQIRFSHQQGETHGRRTWKGIATDEGGPRARSGKSGDSGPSRRLTLLSAARCSAPHFSELSFKRTAMRHTEYFLRSHAFFCLIDSFCFFLDLKTDRYLCTDGRDFQLLGPHLHGWSTKDETAAHGNTRISPSTERLAIELLAEGILSDHPADYKDARPIPTIQPVRALHELGTQKLPLLRMPLAFYFLKATATANRHLRRNALEFTIQSIARQKQSRVFGTPALDTDRIASLTLGFNRLRLTFPRSYLCLFDSLALMYFFAFYNIYPTLVFGVRAEPFGAHCWVQADDVALNDTIEHVGQFTPIMSV
jgi:hypothetical protein